jgi:hypothetical protein
MDAYAELDVVWPVLDQQLVADADTPAELARLTGAQTGSGAP